MNNFSTYKSKIASRYIPVDAEQVGLKIAESEYYYASVKHDGHLVFLSVKNGKALLYDRNGDILKIPGIINAASSMKGDVLLAGELCCFEKDSSTSHREVNTALAKPDKYDLRFGAFDILEQNGEPITAELKEKTDQLSSLLNNGKEVFAIEQHYFESRKDLIAFYKKAAEEKAEGIIVKAPNGITYKVKQVHHLDLVILGYAESVGEREGWLRELLLGFALGKNQFQIVTKCGGGFSDKDRQELPKQLEKITTECEYIEVSGAKTAFVFVKPELVAEISCLDFINENSSGAIQKAVLNFDEKKGYLYEGNQPTLSIISPNFVRIRTDKKATDKEAGTAQAYHLLMPLEKTNTEGGAANSEIIIREVFIKEGKGGTVVRKFVGLKTNKEATGLYSPYVVVYSDYSGSRKTPIEQEIFLCNSAQQVSSKIDELKEENIKKGWEPVK